MRVWIASVAMSLMFLSLTGQARAQGNFVVSEADIPTLKLNHYFTPDKKHHDADFEWTFTKTSFTIKKGKSAIPKHIASKLLPEGVTADEITGDWALKEGRLQFSKIKAADKDGKKDVSLVVFKTAPTVVRVSDPDQVFFEVVRK